MRAVARRRPPSPWRAMTLRATWRLQCPPVGTRSPAGSSRSTPCVRRPSTTSIRLTTLAGSPQIGHRQPDLTTRPLRFHVARDEYAIRLHSMIPTPRPSGFASATHCRLAYRPTARPARRRISERERHRPRGSAVRSSVEERQHGAHEQPSSHDSSRGGLLSLSLMFIQPRPSHFCRRYAVRPRVLLASRCPRGTRTKRLSNVRSVEVEQCSSQHSRYTRASTQCAQLRH